MAEPLKPPNVSLRRCLASTGKGKRVSPWCTFDEKLLNLARLIKCSQDVAEQQEAGLFTTRLFTTLVCASRGLCATFLDLDCSLT